MSLLLIATDGTETGATAANKINNAITATDNNTQQISTNKLDIISLNDRTSTFNDTINDLAVRTSATEKNLSNINTRLSGVERLSYTCIVVKGATTQTVAIDTPTKLQWMQTVVLDGGKTAITADLITQEFIFGEDGIYKIQGTINIQAPTDDEIILELYVNGTPSTSKQYIVGKGITKPVTTSWFLTESFTTNDTISLFVTSSGTTVDVSYANLTIEKTAI